MTDVNDFIGACLNVSNALRSESTLERMLKSNERFLDLMESKQSFTFREYDKLAARTAKVTDNSVHNWVEGLNGEAAELSREVLKALGILTNLNISSGTLAEWVKKMEFHNKEIAADVLLSELGDNLWYLNELSKILGFTLEEVARFNAGKLAKRHGLDGT